MSSVHSAEQATQPLSGKLVSYLQLVWIHPTASDPKIWNLMLCPEYTQAVTKQILSHPLLVMSCFGL